MPTNQPTGKAFGQLTDRESEILRKAGERVFSLSKRLADQEKESDHLRTETQSLRELLAESREVRKVLSDQINSLHRELDREYEERSELRRLLASLHLQMQELLPVVTGLSQAQHVTLPGPEPSPLLVKREQPASPNGVGRSSLVQRLLTASGIVTNGRRRKFRRS